MQLGCRVRNAPKNVEVRVLNRTLHDAYNCQYVSYFIFIQLNAQNVG